MSSSRRDFLRASGMVVMGGAGAISLDELFAQSSLDSAQSEGDGPNREKPTLVTIFLRGGADSLHAFVPVGDDLYYQWRPGIAIRAKPRGNERAALQIGKSDYWGLNPWMKPMLPMIESGLVVPVLNVGSPNGTRSHFRAQDYMERAAPGNDRVTQGWLNRYLAATRKPFDAPLRGLSARSLVPRALRGQYPVLAGNNHTEQMDMFEDLYATDNLVNQTARDGAGMQTGSRLDEIPTAEALRERAQKLRTSDEARDIITESGTQAVERIKALDKASGTPLQANWPRGPLADQLRTIAKVIKANVGLEVAQADYSGWDHHTGQGGADGRMSRMLGHLTECLVAFNAELGPERSKKVLVMTMTEFGRTLKENGNSGTDHGRGGLMMAMGGMLKGPSFYGEWNGLDDASRGRYQPVHTDFRAVFAEALTKLFHIDPFQLDIFPEYRASERDYLGFMEQLPEMG